MTHVEFIYYDIAPGTMPESVPCAVLQQAAVCQLKSVQVVAKGAYDNYSHPGGMAKTSNQGSR